jgi:phosphonate transport system substrate-binding protein
MNMFRSIGRFLVISFSLCLSMLYPLKASARETLIFGIHPYLPAEEIIERFTPLAKHIGKELGVTVEIVISSTYEEHIERTGRNEFDLAFMGPFSYVQMTALHGTKPVLARLEIQGSPLFRGVIFVPESSAVQSLVELKGKRFAFGDRESTMGYLVPRYVLWKAGVDLKDLEGYTFMANHNNVALSVLSGDYEAGAVRDDVFDKYQPKGLRAIAYTPQLSEHLFVAKSTMSRQKMEKLRGILLAVGKKPEEQAILNALKLRVTRLSGARDSDYDNIRQIYKTLKNLKEIP